MQKIHFKNSSARINNMYYVNYKQTKIECNTINTSKFLQNKFITTSALELFDKWQK